MSTLKEAIHICPALCFRKSQFILSHSISLCIKLKALTSQVGLQIQDNGSNKTHPVILSQVTPGNPNNNSAKDREQVSLNQFYPSLSLQAGAWRPFWGWWDAALGKGQVKLVRQIPAWPHPDLPEKTQQPSDLDDPVLIKHLFVASNRGLTRQDRLLRGVALPRAEIFFLQPCLLSPCFHSGRKGRHTCPGGIAAPHLWLQLPW